LRIAKGINRGVEFWFDNWISKEMGNAFGNAYLLMSCRLSRMGVVPPLQKQMFIGSVLHTLQDCPLRHEKENSSFSPEVRERHPHAGAYQ
jgi:hypothetical protein